MATTVKEYYRIRNEICIFATAAFIYVNPMPGRIYIYIFIILYYYMCVYELCLYVTNTIAPGYHIFCLFVGQKWLTKTHANAFLLPPSSTDR